MADPTVTHSTPADGTFSATGQAAWDDDHTLTGLLNADSPTFAGITLTGLTSGRVALVGTGGVLTDDAGLTYSATGSIGSGPLATIGTGTGTSTGWKIGNYGNGSSAIWAGAVTPAATNYALYSTGASTFINGTSLVDGYANNTLVLRLSSTAGAFTTARSYFGTADAGGQTGRTTLNKAVTAFTDGVAKATFTVTIPNAAHTATLEVEVTGICGAGGAIGAGEASATNSYKFNIVRTAGVNAVVGASAAFGAAAANVAGGTTLTATAAASAIAGAVGDPNTFTVNVTITKGGGASDNHTCLIYGKLMNANATGITIA